jgi:hypothetical protein
MRIIIAGSRRYEDYSELVASIEASGFDVTEVVSGGAKGADSLGERWARERGIPIKRFDADWDGLGKRAGAARNGEMAAYAEALIAFPLADSRGTALMIEQATKAGLLVYVHKARHRCHANGCQADDCHPELPFCRRHTGMLPQWLRKALWSGRRLDGRCGACADAESMPLDARHRAVPEWPVHFNLAVAIALTAEFGDCGAPPELHDDQGFCWGCGVAAAADTYRMALVELAKHTM